MFIVEAMASQCVSLNYNILEAFLIFEMNCSREVRTQFLAYRTSI